jgi:4-hydroxybenzoate polyprenyltransferase
MIFEWAVNRKLFRNINHAIWFSMSMWILTLITAYYFYPHLRIIILLPIAIHGVAFLQSVYIVYIKKEKSDTLSKDCTWFNALMLIIYIIMIFISKSIK